MTNYTNIALAISSTLGIIVMFGAIVVGILKHLKQNKMNLYKEENLQIEMVVGANNEKFIRIRNPQLIGSIEINESEIEKVQTELSKFKLLFDKLKKD